MGFAESPASPSGVQNMGFRAEGPQLSNWHSGYQAYVGKKMPLVTDFIKELAFFRILTKLLSLVHVGAPDEGNSYKALFSWLLHCDPVTYLSPPSTVTPPGNSPGCQMPPQPT